MEQTIATGQTIMMSISTHVFMFWVMIGVAFINIILAYTIKDFFSFYKKYKFLYPQYNIILGGLFFTGIIVMGMEQFHFGWTVWVMMVVWAMLLALSIMMRKAFKRIRNEKETQIEFRAFVKKKYSADIILLLLTYFIIL